MAGWEYDPKAREFEHAKVLHERNKFRRPAGHDLEPDDIEYEKGELIRKLRHGEIGRENVKEVATSMTDVLTRRLNPREIRDTNGYSYNVSEVSTHSHTSNGIRSGRKFPVNSEYMEPNALWSPNAVEDPWNPRYLDRGGPQSNRHHQSKMSYENVMTSRAPIVMTNGQSDREETYSEIPSNLLMESSIYSQPPNFRQQMRNKHDINPVAERIYEKLNILRPLDQQNGLNMKHSEHNGRQDGGRQGGRDAFPSRGFERANYTNQKERSSLPHDTMAHGDKQLNLRQPYENYPSQQPSHQPAHQCHTLRGRPGATLRRTPPEYLKEKRFVEQNQLELRQRHEHDALVRDLERARGNQIQRLETEIKKQADSALKELFMQMDSGSFQGDINTEKLRIEQRFRRMREEQMKHVMSNLSSQERMRVDDMVDRQTQEMLQLIDQKVPNKLPDPIPPKKKKNSVVPGAHVFDDIDFQAMQVAQYEQDSFTELVYELTKNCKNTLQKTRAIFKWLTYKDLNLMMCSEELTEESPYYFLNGIKYGLESYHELFKRLCSYSGIPVKIIRGLSKSAGYRPGMPLGDNRFKNSWAVVHIDNAWRFIDCHWGARHVSNPDEFEDPRCFCYEVDEFYFLTDPEDMIYMHFPDDPEWQLLDRPVNLEHFIGLPVLKSQFFQYKIKINTKLSSVLETDTGKLELILSYSEKYPLAFNARLESDGEEIDGYCIHHYMNAQAIFNISLPRKGVFFLTLFSCDKNKGNNYNNICSFRVVCTRVDVKPFCKFPKLPDGYGLTSLGSDLGLSAEKFDEYYLVCNEDKMILNIKFKCPVRASQKLSKGNSDGQVINTVTAQGNMLDLDRLVFQRYKDHCFVSYIIRFLDRGIYVFSLYAGYSESKSQTLECACRYLIQCNKKSPGPIRTYPKTLQHWHKCRLHEPTSGELKLNKNVKFKLEVAKAEAVAVILGQQWFYLKRDESGKAWEGVAHTGKDLRITADVYARYSDNDKDFFPLLEYKLVKGD